MRIVHMLEKYFFYSALTFFMLKKLFAGYENSFLRLLTFCCICFIFLFLIEKLCSVKQEFLVTVLSYKKRSQVGQTYITFCRIGVFSSEDT